MLVRIIALIPGAVEVEAGDEPALLTFHWGRIAEQLIAGGS